METERVTAAERPPPPEGCVWIGRVVAVECGLDAWCALAPNRRSAGRTCAYERVDDDPAGWDARHGSSGTPIWRAAFIAERARAEQAERDGAAVARDCATVAASAVPDAGLDIYAAAQQVRMAARIAAAILAASGPPRVDDPCDVCGRHTREMR